MAVIALTMQEQAGLLIWKNLLFSDLMVRREGTRDMGYTTRETNVLYREERAGPALVLHQLRQALGCSCYYFESLRRCRSECGNLTVELRASLRTWNAWAVDGGGRTLYK